MNPVKYAQMMKYLTRAKKQKPDLPDVFPASQAPIPAKTKIVKDMEAVNRFVRANPRQDMAGGGMLVQPGFGGTRQGYAKSKKKGPGVYDRSKIDFRETEAYKKKITPKGYIGISELIELIDNPKLKLGNFQQARKFERNPKKYPGKKNYVYNYIKKLLNEKQVGKAGSESLTAQKFFYKKPTKAELDKINSFIDSRILETGTVDNVKIFHKEFGKLFEGKKTKGFFNDTLSLDKARAALKKYGIKATDSQLARAMMRLGQIYDGHTFQNEINIPKNKSAGKFIEKSFNELDIYNGWRSASYDAAIDDINKVVGKSAGDIRSFKYTLNNYIKENYPQIFKNYDVNEIFSLTTSSVRGSYPYAYFIDLTKNDINQKALSSFQGKASIAEGKIQKAITNFRRTGNQKFYDEAVRVADVFNNTTRKNFLSDERIIKVGGVNALKLEIGSQQQIKDKVGFASEYYKKNNLKKWKDQGIDIDAHTAKSGYVKTFDGKTPPRGVVTFQDIIKDGKVDEKQFNNLLQKIGCPGLASGGRAGFDVGTNCQMKGANLINSGMKNASPAQLKNFAAFANRAKNLGRNIMRFGIIPEALYVAADSAIRMGMGDNFNEAILRATNYLTPFDGIKKAEMLEADRFFGPEVAGIIGKSLDYKNELAKVQSLEDKKSNLENLSGGGEFDYIGNLNQDIKNIDAQLKQATNNLNKFKMTDAEQLYANQMQKEVDDARSAGSFFTKLKSKFRDIEPDSDIETLGIPEKTQADLNKRMLTQAPTIYKIVNGKLIEKNLSEATQTEIMDHVRLLKPYGYEFSTKDLLKEQNILRGMSLSDQEQLYGPEATYGFSGTVGEPINKPTMEKKQNVIGDMEKEIIGQTNVANPFEIDISDIGTGLRGFAAAGGGIAKEAGDSSGPPPASGPMSQGLQGLMKRVRNL